MPIGLIVQVDKVVEVVAYHRLVIAAEFLNHDVAVLNKGVHSAKHF